MGDKKGYQPPQIFRVELNPDQAILTACSITATSIVSKGNARCKPPSQVPPLGCKNEFSSGSGGGDSGARLS